MFHFNSYVHLQSYHHYKAMSNTAVILELLFKRCTVLVASILDMRTFVEAIVTNNSKHSVW